MQSIYRYSYFEK